MTVRIPFNTDNRVGFAGAGRMLGVPAPKELMLILYTACGVLLFNRLRFIDAVVGEAALCALALV